MYWKLVSPDSYDVQYLLFIAVCFDDISRGSLLDIRWYFALFIYIFFI